MKTQRKNTKYMNPNRDTDVQNMYRFYKYISILPQVYK